MDNASWCPSLRPGSGIPGLAPCHTLKVIAAMSGLRATATFQARMTFALQLDQFDPIESLPLGLERAWTHHHR